ncbi:MAG: hypothetical protein GW938_17225 [Leptospira sp.]|nr:hypothetical protein [Leptospira sp.]
MRFIIILLLTTALYSQEEPTARCLSGDCQNGIGKKGLDDKNYMEGKFKNGKPDGKFLLYRDFVQGDSAGEMFFKNGNLDTSKPVKEYYEEGTYYVGFYNSEYEMHGKGKLYDLDDNLLYEGNFKNGKKDFTVTIDFIYRSMKMPSKWIDGKTSGKFYFKEFRNEDELTDKIKDWDTEMDWNEFFIAEVLWDTKEIIGQRFWLVVPKNLESKFDSIAGKEKAIVSIEGFGIGMVHLNYESYPMIQVEKVK